ncbi:hypothetical protein [Methylocystis heyeri]|uniref:Replication protein n=1 Tax=Methylocystis heyeri TaxID=391905 RepID=A0A6B8KFZ5_9HYPH|nr:hypothetical protein [Methylocystis heyeri]QGM46647.1 hypothetical protein H2LOC_013625 [Methylocystis heyeri]
MTWQNSWLNSQSAYAEIKAYVEKKKLKDEGLIVKYDIEPEPPEALEKLPLWLRTSTSKFYVHLSPTGAAKLLPSSHYDDDLPRVANYYEIIKELAKYVGGRQRSFVVRFLRDVDFQYHQSTNGRWNDALGRWERYGVRPVEDWRVSKQKNGFDAGYEVSERTFHRIKDKLKALALIEARSALWLGKTCLWIKPGEKLERILWEPGYWETLKAEFAPAPKPKGGVKVKKGMPRGLSAKHAAINEELKKLFKKAMGHDFETACPHKRQEVFDKLTTPIQITPKHVKAPYAQAGSPRYIGLRKALLLDE